MSDRLRIGHIWFDLAGTLMVRTPEYTRVLDELRYSTYSEVTGKPVDDFLVEEFEEMYEKHGSNSLVFAGLGMPGDFWVRRMDRIDKDRYYYPIPEVYETLDQLRHVCPISLFSNGHSIGMEDMLRRVEIDLHWFTYVLTGDDIPNRKPALDGFERIIAQTQLSPGEILYVGDRVKADILPAKQLNLQTALVWSESPEADYSLLRFEELLLVVGEGVAVY